MSEGLSEVRRLIEDVGTDARRALTMAQKNNVIINGDAYGEVKNPVLPAINEIRSVLKIYRIVIIAIVFGVLANTVGFFMLSVVFYIFITGNQ